MNRTLEIVKYQGDELAGLRTDDNTVMVSIRHVCDALGIDTATQYRKLQKASWATIVQMTTVAEDGKWRDMAMLDLESLPMWLTTIQSNRVSDYSREKLERYQKEAKKVLADHFFGRKTFPVPTPEPATIIGTLEHKKTNLGLAIQIAEMLGYEGNQAVLTANKGLKSNFGYDLLSEFQVALPSPNNNALLTPTEIGQRIGDTAIGVNKRLAILNLQYKPAGTWRLTEKGKQYGTYLDVGKAHHNGTPIQQIKWQETVIELL